MKHDAVKSGIVRLLLESGRAMSASELSSRMGLRGAAKKKLQGYLVELSRAGAVVPAGRSSYSLGQEKGALTGELAIVRSGKGYVETGRGAAVRIEATDTGTALPGDRVLVRLDPGAGSGHGETPAGKIVRVVERARRDIVGTLRLTDGVLRVIPIDPAYRQPFTVHNADPGDAGKRVVMRFTSWDERGTDPQGEIIEVMGVPEKVSDESDAAVRHFGLCAEFSPEALREAEQASRLMDEFGTRTDLRGRGIVTIDPERARDYDDALSLEVRDDGMRVLGVHIADVSHFVTEGSALDMEARLRGNSTYLPDRVLPMLPEQLSNGVCSLKPDSDRLAFSAFLVFDEDGALKEKSFARTVIRSACRLTYTQAMGILDGGAGPDGMPPFVPSLLEGLNTLSGQLRRRRFAAGALNLDTAECEIRIGPDGRIADIISVPDDDSHHLVEECMVVANEAVADELRSASVRYISRRHDPPSPLKLEALEEELSELGLKSGDLRDRRRIASLLKETQDHPLARHIRFAVLRSMSRAVYSVESDGHFGLAKKCYAHFTSPIRRYPDLTLHRALARHLASRDAGSRPAGRAVDGKLGATDDDPLTATANHCTKTEYMSEMAERMVDEIMKLRFLAQSAASDSPRSFDAVVVRATPFGVFVELPDLQIQGLVHVSALSGDHAGFNRKSRSLSVGGKVYRLGTSLKVRPAAVDTESRRVDFRLEAGPACTPPPRRPGKKTGGMRGPKGPRKRTRGRGQVRA